MLAVRIWKRDASSNYMELDIASDCLRRNAEDKLDRQQSRDALARRLVAGETIATRCAWFSLAGCERSSRNGSVIPGTQAAAVGDLARS